MTAGRLLLLVIAVGAAVWLFQSRVTGPSAPAAKFSAPLERARSAARSSEAHRAQIAAAGDLDSASAAGGITENMTPEQVRALLGPPDEVSSEESASGNPRERWIYRKAGKSVV